MERFASMVVKAARVARVVLLASALCVAAASTGHAAQIGPFRKNNFFTGLRFVAIENLPGLPSLEQNGYPALHLSN